VLSSLSILVVVFCFVWEIASGRRIGTFHRIKIDNSVILIEIRARTAQGKVNKQIQV